MSFDVFALLKSESLIFMSVPESGDVIFPLSTLSSKDEACPQNRLNPL